MRPARVVPQEPVNKLRVEGIDIVGKEHPILLDERIGQSAVEAFNLRVHLRRTRIGVKMHDAVLFKKNIKMFGKLASVVCLHMRKRKRSDFLELLHEIRGGV